MIARRCGPEAEGSPAGIRPNVKHAFSQIRGQPRMVRGERTGVMVSVVFVVVFSRSDEPKFSGRLVGAQVTDFAGRVTRDVQEEKSAAPRAFHFNSKPLVGLLL